MTRSQCQCEFVIQPAVWIPQQLILINHQQVGAFPAHEPVLLCLECGDNDRGLEVLGEITGGNANRPSPAAPFSKLIIGQRPGGYSV